MVELVVYSAEVTLLVMVRASLPSRSGSRNFHSETVRTPVTHSCGLQAALQIANAASTNAYDDQYPSPYTVEAVRQGMDLPWWQKLLGARFKDGKFQLARLQVCVTSSHSACVACLVPVYEAQLRSRASAWSVLLCDQSAACKFVALAQYKCSSFL